MALVVSRKPTLARLRAISVGLRDRSLLRCLEYARLAEAGLEGNVLDFGGGKNANYRAMTGEWGKGFTLSSANIDTDQDPDYLLDGDGKIPTEAEAFDAVISLNTFEHIYQLGAALSEIRRVLKPGGRLIFIVPFIFRVHAHPNDYHRGTPAFWEAVLGEHGLPVARIESLTWGPFSTGCTVSGLPGPLKGLRLRFALLMDVVWGHRRFRNHETLEAAQEDPVCNAPIGYFVEAKAH
jgi:SAM-dependent methyltransferase